MVLPLPGLAGRCASTVEYAVSVAARNGVGWSPFGPAAKIRISDHKPLAPAAPTLTLIKEDGVDFKFSRPPATAVGGALRMVVIVRAAGGTDTLYYDTRAKRLIGKGNAGFNMVNCYIPCIARDLDCAIGGLDPDTEYEVKVVSVNLFGHSPSPGASFKTLPSEVEVTGVKTAEERDEALKRQAVDVDVDDDDAPETKRPRPSLAVGGMVKRVGAVAGQRELLGKTGQLVGKKGNHAQVDFGADLGGIHTVLQKYLEPVDADDDSEKNASQSALAHPPSA